MAVKASATITLSCYRDTQSVTRYYKLQSSTASTPSKPTTKPPSGWTDAEPSYTSGSTNTLYFCDLSVFSDGTWSYSTVSKSSSYEAAKEAYNKAVNAQSTAEQVLDSAVEITDQAKQEAISEAEGIIKESIDSLLIGDSSVIDGTEYSGSSLYEIITSIITRTASLEQNEEGFDFNFESLEQTITQIGDEMSTEFAQRLKYIRFVDGAIILGDADSLFEVRITNERISFVYNGVTLAYLDSQRLNVEEANLVEVTIEKNLWLGEFRWFKRPNGNLALKWEGD